MTKKVIWLLEDEDGRIQWDEWPCETKKEALDLIRRRESDLTPGGEELRPVKFVRAQELA
jgi:hypothetical protein